MEYIDRCVKYIYRHVKENQICAAGPEVWLDLGIELLRIIAALEMMYQNAVCAVLICSSYGLKDSPIRVGDTYLQH